MLISKIGFSCDSFVGLTDGKNHRQDLLNISKPNRSPWTLGSTIITFIFLFRASCTSGKADAGAIPIVIKSRREKIPARTLPRPVVITKTGAVSSFKTLVFESSSSFSPSLFSTICNMQSSFFSSSKLYSSCSIVLVFSSSTNPSAIKRLTRALTGGFLEQRSTTGKCVGAGFFSFLVLAEYPNNEYFSFFFFLTSGCCISGLRFSSPISVHTKSPTSAITSCTYSIAQRATSS
mmetsp:Transcript_14385/g.28758  ORF Transcript_14385/g.28758 Transcript_14385/m.28758 type:complete len:234 (+) Transcript_14385:479-1180(+)